MQGQHPDIFEEDVAAEVADLFADALADGLSVRTATRRVLEDVEDYLEDDEQRPLVWLALAVLQLEHGAVQPTVRRQALTALARPDALWHGEDDEEDLRADRQQMLAQLAAQLRASTLIAPAGRRDA